MSNKSYPPAQPDAIGMADALDNEEALNFDGTTTGGGDKIRDQVTLKPTPKADFQPAFGAAKQVKVKSTPRSQEPAPMNFAPGLPRDPRQVQQAKARLEDTGTTYEPERERPEFPEAKQTTVDDAPPTMGSMVTNIPEFAQKVYGENAPSYERADPLAVHGKDADKPEPPPAAPAKVDSAPPPIQSKPAVPAPAPVAPRPVTPAAPAPAPARTAPAAAPAPEAPAPEIPKNAKKVITTTTTTTKIVDGKEVVETHVHHDVVLKKKGFGMPKFLKNMGKKRTTTTTETTTATS